MAKKKTVEIPKPLLTRYCIGCGKIFCASHPKDTQKYCEKCRKEKENGNENTV